MVRLARTGVCAYDIISDILLRHTQTHTDQVLVSSAQVDSKICGVVERAICFGYI